MKKRVIISVISAGVLLLALIGSVSHPSQPASQNAIQPTSANPAPVKEDIKKLPPVCDGTSVKANCVVEGVVYSTYVYHPAVAEKSHAETVTTYEKQVTSYCTLCNDGTYSPSCATGKGTCSHHGGVAQWNAPRYTDVPVKSTKNVIDSAAQEAYYEKVAK